MTPRKLGLKLGSHPFDHGALRLDNYVASSAPTVPDTVTVPNADRYQWGMLGNDNAGDCVEAALFHADEALYLKRHLDPYPYQTPECVALYSALTGYNPADESTDNGTDPSAAMAWWVKSGLPGHKLAGFGALPPNSPNIRRAIWEFGAVILAVAMPQSARSQGVNWRVVGDGHTGASAPGSWGGHGISADSFTPDLLQFRSWGESGDMDDAFAAAYLEQVFVPLSRDALDRAGVGPAGFNFAHMRKDLP